MARSRKKSYPIWNIIEIITFYFYFFDYVFLLIYRFFYFYFLDYVFRLIFSFVSREKEIRP